MIYLILGMHKSGTTLISQILHHSGINMVDDLSKKTYDDGNKYERQSTLEINKALLSNYDSDGHWNPQKIYSNDLTFNIKQKILSFVKKSNESESIGFKDPRLCLTYPVWKTYLPEHRLIVIYRKPEEIWQHYSKHPNFLVRYYNQWHALHAWCVYANNIFEYVDNKSNLEYIFLDYNRIIQSNDELLRLKHFLGINIKDMRVNNLYRSKALNPTGFSIALKLFRFIYSYDIPRIYNQYKQY